MDGITGIAGPGDARLIRYNAWGKYTARSIVTLRERRLLCTFFAKEERRLRQHPFTDGSEPNLFVDHVIGNSFI